MKQRNPYVRIRELTGLGQREFERKYQLSHTVMVNIESGLYPSLSDYMIESLGRECAEKGVAAGKVLESEYEAGTLQEAYQAWQAEMRKLARPMLRIDTFRSTPDLSPMHFFIKDTTGSLRSFCTTLKVPTASVMRYVTGATRSMPKVLDQALHDAGMAKSNIESLRIAQEAWMVAQAS